MTTQTTQQEPRLRLLPSSKTLRVGLLGLGTVGQGLCALLEDKRDFLLSRHGVDLRVSRVLVRDMGRERRVRPPGASFASDAESFLESDFDIVVECMGGIEPAGSYIAAFLKRGTPVVTANKALLAEQGEALLALAARYGTQLRFEASVAAGIPILGLIERSLRTFTVTRVCGILNGTSNYILTRMAEEGDSMANALEEAKRLGFAEVDPSLDLSGMDAAQKLSVLVRALGRTLPLKRVEVTGLDEVRAEDCDRARAFGCVLKPVAAAELAGNPAQGFVGPALVREDHPLAGVVGVTNGVHLLGNPLGALFLSGPGAGGPPTAASILDDLMTLALGFPAPPHGECAEESAAPGREAEGMPGRWFLSFTLGERTSSADDLLDFVSSTGLTFRELREFKEGGALTLAGLTAKTRPERIERLTDLLRAMKSLRRFIAFRMLDPAEGEEGQ